MIEKTVVYNCDDTIQMKALAMLIQKASGFRSSMYISHENRRANAKSLLGVMSLGLRNGMELVVSAEGSDEAEACAGISAWLENPQI